MRQIADANTGTTAVAKGYAFDDGGAGDAG